MYFNLVHLNGHSNLDGPLNKRKYYVIRVEFQVRSSPNIHFFLWIVNVPILPENNNESYTKWLDKMISEEFLDED